MLAKIIRNIAKKYKIDYLSPFGLCITTTRTEDFSSVLSGHALNELAKYYKLIVFRGFNEIPSLPLVNYAKTIGPLLEWEFGSVMEMKVHEKPKNYLFTHDHVPFHWDGAFYKEPRFLLFNCIEAPDINAGGETLFTDTRRILINASEEEKTIWSKYKLTYTTEKLAHYGGQITVPLMQKHIDTNEEILRFAEPVPDSMPNPVSVEILGLDKAVTNKFINDMTARCYDSQYCYTHTWNKNDFLIADNNALLHARHAFKEFTQRHLRRIQVL